MENKNEINFKINDDQVIYKASFIKRFIARILDFSIALFIPIIMSFIYFVVNLQTDNWYPQPWNWEFLLSGILAMIGIIFTMVIYPIINKKNPGQSIGKKILKIKILNIENKNISKVILIRELPISIFYILPIVLQLISGIEAKNLFASYLKQNEEYKKGIFDFLFNVLPNGVDGIKKVYMWQSIVNFISMIISRIEVFIFIGISISIIASPKNIGINDKKLGIAIVDISSIKNIKESEENV